jgi:hypothetical protein
MTTADPWRPAATPVAGSLRPLGQQQAVTAITCVAATVAAQLIRQRQCSNKLLHIQMTGPAAAGLLFSTLLLLLAAAAAAG